MATNEKKGVTVKIDADLHAEVKQYIEEHGMTMGDWMVCNLKKVVNVAGHKEIDEHFAEISKNGILLLVDGLDELDIDDRKELLHLLNSFCENPDNVVITTIRKEVLVEDSWINEFSGFQQIALSEFSREQVKDFIIKWKKHTNNMDENCLDDMNMIVKTIFENPYIKELAANPLFLTLMMLISEKDGTFPRSRTRVYEEANLFLLFTGDQVMDFHTICWIRLI